MSDNPPPEPVPSTRLMSVDALRGFDMFWIVGGIWVARALNQMSDTPVTGFLLGQLRHERWEGLRFLDLVFPLFIFIMGISIVFSLTKALEAGGRAQAIRRIIPRGILLYLLGIFFYGGFNNTWPNIRLVGVLQLIAICYVAGAILFCYLKPRGLMLVTIFLLVGYWGLMTFVPIRNYRFDDVEHLVDARVNKETEARGEQPPKPVTDAQRKEIRNQVVQQATREYFATTEFVTGKFDMGLNLANHLDFLYLPGRRVQAFWDPQGLLATLPAIASGLLGIFAGLLLRRRDIGDNLKVAYLAGFGVAGVVLGSLWGLQFPVIKNIWTSSYVLVAGGYSALLLAAFYWMVEIKNWRRWCQPFVWIGCNALTIYLAVLLVDFPLLASRLAGGDISNWMDSHVARGSGQVLVTTIACVLVFAFARFLYKRKIFLRI